MQAPLINRPFWYIIKCYQIVFSPFLGRSCRFYPSCSNYALWLLEKRGLLIALAQIAWRVARCNPLFKGGVDYPSIPRDKNLERNLLIRARSTRKLRTIAWFMVPKGDRYILIKRRKDANACQTDGTRLSDKLLPAR
ncbi:MAG: membrane protein insertion efficiency factor YidD [Helicobacteraceae bacterium]|nr:membrane protein insertion efficiency factor YidD [Helicobacteraceae bacterium]